MTLNKDTFIIMNLTVQIYTKHITSGRLFLSDNLEVSNILREISDKFNVSIIFCKFCKICGGFVLSVYEHIPHINRIQYLQFTRD
jgi:hypothetical protein